jgi:N6-adenosine-specific RNA methylase IME4
MSTALVPYDVARRALAEAVRFDDVKNIHNKAEAMQLYAKRARDGHLIADATAIRKHAERRLGQLMAEDKKTGKLAKRPAGPGRGKKGVKVGLPKNPTLSEQGVDKNLADRARKAAAMPEHKFEAQVEKAVKVAVAAAEGDREVVKAARAQRQMEKRARRQQREAELGAKIMAMPDKKYGVIYADPPWKFEVYDEATGSDRAAGNHYPTMDTAAIRALKVPAAKDCVLFLWSTVPHLTVALYVMAAWGFEYKSHLIWAKNTAGNGYWNFNKHEVLLIGTRGDVPAPAPGDQPMSLITAPVGKHSEKPVVFRKLIEKMFPSLPKIELFAREEVDGWDYYGNEVEVDCPDCGGTGIIEAA